MDSCRKLFRGIEWVYVCDPLSRVHYAKRGAIRVLLQYDSQIAQSVLGLFCVCLKCLCVTFTVPQHALRTFAVVLATEVASYPSWGLKPDSLKCTF